MNQKLSYTFKGMLLFLACLATTGCSREEMLTPETPADSRPKVELAFSASPDLTTRTTLPGPDNLQHVREVQLYIFNGTENTAMCVASEVVDWTDIAAPDEGRPTASKKHPVQYKSFEADKPYTFLAIGLDDRSGDTYNLPKAVEVNTTTLANAKAILATGKTRQDIAVSELFGGSIVLTPDANNTVTGTIDLRSPLSPGSRRDGLVQEHPPAGERNGRGLPADRAVQGTEQKHLAQQAPNRRRRNHGSYRRNGRRQQDPRADRPDGRRFSTG